MKTKLQYFLETNKFISIYCNDNMNNFLYGKLLSLNDFEFALMLISPNGDFDGILAKEINNIVRIEFDGQYEEKMSKLISFDTEEYCCNIDNKDIKRAVLSLAMNTEKIVSIEFQNSQSVNIMGFVEKVEENLCKIKQVDDYGYYDGYSYVYISEITQIVYNSNDENRVYRLWEKTIKN